MDLEWGSQSGTHSYGGDLLYLTVHLCFNLYFLLLLQRLSKCQLLSRVQLFATPWTITCQAPLSMRLSRQEDWSGLPCPSPGDLPDPGIEPRSPTSQANSLPLSHQGNSFCLLVVTFLMNCFFKLSAYFSSGKLCVFLSNL